MIQRSFCRMFSRIAVIALSCLMSPLTFAQSGTVLSFVSQPGDYIGQGQTLSFTTVDANVLFSGQVIQVNAYGPVSYSLYLASPVAGQPLAPGIYEATSASPYSIMGFSGGARGCLGVGRFEIIEAVFDENGQAVRFRANFEQHCDNLSQPGLFGEVSVIGPPVPRINVEVEVDDKLALSRTTRRAIVTGTIRCSLPTRAYVFGILRQEIVHFGAIGGQFLRDIQCTPQLQRWSAEVEPDLAPTVPPGLGFRRGDAEVGIHLEAWDPNYYSDAVINSDHPTTLIVGNGG
jgi:hypothetical protein